MTSLSGATMNPPFHLRVRVLVPAVGRGGPNQPGTELAKTNTARSIPIQIPQQVRPRQLFQSQRWQ